MKQRNSLGCGLFSESVWMDLLTKDDANRPSGTSPPGGRLSGGGPSGGSPPSAGPTGDGPTGDGPTGGSPSGGSPTGAGPTGDSPTGDGPTGSSPTGTDLTGSGPSVPPSVRDLQSHIEACSRCRDEWRAFARLALNVRLAVQPSPAMREAFLDSVLATVQAPPSAGEAEADIGVDARFKTWPRVATHRHVRQQVAAERHGRPPIGTEPGARQRSGSKPNRPWLPKNAVVAAVLALMAVLGAGLWSRPWTTPQPAAPDSATAPNSAAVADIPGGTASSTGQAVAGGFVARAPLTAGSGTVRAASLRPHGEAAAVSGAAGGPDAPSAARPAGTSSVSESDSEPGRSIRVTLGVTAGATTSVFSEPRNVD